MSRSSNHIPFESTLGKGSLECVAEYPHHYHLMRRCEKSAGDQTEAAIADFVEKFADHMESERLYEVDSSWYGKHVITVRAKGLGASWEKFFVPAETPENFERMQADKATMDVNVMNLVESNEREALVEEHAFDTVQLWSKINSILGDALVREVGNNLKHSCALDNGPSAKRSKS
jgi:hypothetical protein